MSEPSGFKRFMQRLSIRRRSRRPKSPKWQEKASHRAEIESSSSAGSPEKKTNFGGGSLQHASAKNGAAKGSENHLSPESLNERKSQGSATSSSAGISPSASDGVLSSHEQADTGDSTSEDMRRVNGVYHTENASKDNAGEHECEIDAGKGVCKDHGDVKGSLSVPGADTQNDVDATIWQRRSALFLNTEDMIREGLIKTKQSDRRASDPPTRNGEGNNNSGAVASPEAISFEGTGIQARRNTSGSRGKRPMLTIAITPSGSEPSLNQYVNVPEKPKAKQVARLQPGEWDRYDSEENVYHHLDKVIGQPGYQNLPGSEKTMSSTSLNNSYQNLAARLPSAHSYENVAGARNEIHYINVEAKQQQAVNYIKVSGSGPPTPIQKNPSFSSRKGNPDYTEIDFVKTKRLGEMSREAKKERVERVKKT
jgi:hypothetical protein